MARGRRKGIERKGCKGRHRPIVEMRKGEDTKKKRDAERRSQGRRACVVFEGEVGRERKWEEERRVGWMLLETRIA
jgi:hypothetical protein